MMVIENLKYYNIDISNCTVIRLYADHIDNRIHAIMFNNKNKKFILALGYLPKNLLSLGIVFQELDDSIEYLYRYYKVSEIPF